MQRLGEGTPPYDVCNTHNNEQPNTLQQCVENTAPTIYGRAQRPSPTKKNYKIRFFVHNLLKICKKVLTCAYIFGINILYLFVRVDVVRPFKR